MTTQLSFSQETVPDIDPRRLLELLAERLKEEEEEEEEDLSPFRETCVLMRDPHWEELGRERTPVLVLHELRGRGFHIEFDPASST